MYDSAQHYLRPRPRSRPWWLTLLLALAWLPLAGLVLWAIGAFWFDFPIASLRRPLALFYGVAVVGLLAWVPGAGRKVAAVAAAVMLVLAWWFTLAPSDHRPWQPDVAQTAWAEINGDRVTLHNVRACDYRTETDYTPHWETRTVDLSHLTGLDLAITYWGSPYMAHPILSFQFSNAPPICFSIETRKEVGESYSALGGFYRQYELIYLCAEERDVIRLRTNFREGEDVYLYHTIATPENARERFLEYLTAMNRLRDHPRWYNAATSNCTTSIRTQRAATDRPRWDWRILVNGYMDEMLYEHGSFVGGLPFSELRRQAHINDAAHTANDDPSFSARIRAGRAGFAAPPSASP